MNYQPEAKESRKTRIDCYWESHDMRGEELYIYPSLPEPYVNIYFPVHSEEKSTMKGISSKADFFEMKAKLFGIRLYLKGYYQLNLVHISEIHNQIVNFADTGDRREQGLSDSIAKADSFDERIALFGNYFEEKLTHHLSAKEENISKAFQYLISEYRNPKVIQHYAQKSGFSKRTITRWFSQEIGINPKKLTRIARFNNALDGLHSNQGTGFYFDCGYYDQAHFIREFKEFTGLAPEEYLKIVTDLYNQ